MRAKECRDICSLKLYDREIQQRNRELHSSLIGKNIPRTGKWSLYGVELIHCNGGIEGAESWQSKRKIKACQHIIIVAKAILGKHIDAERIKIGKLKAFSPHDTFPDTELYALDGTKLQPVDRKVI